MDVKRFFLYAILVAALALAGCSSNGNGGMPGGTPGDGNGGGNGMTMLDPDAECENGFRFGDNCMDPDAPPPPPPLKDEDKAMAMTRSQAIVNPDNDDSPTAMETSSVLETDLSADQRAVDALHSSSRPGKGLNEVFSPDAILAGAPLYNSLQAMQGGIGTMPALIMEGIDTLGVDDELANEFEEMMPSGDMTGDDMDMTGGDMGMMDRFTRKEYRRTSTEVTVNVMDTITVFDNIGAPGSVTWSAYYATARHGFSSGADAEGVLTVTRTGLTEDQSALFAADAFPSDSGTQMFTYVADDPDTMEDESTRMFEGTFNGVSGTFACGTHLSGGDPTVCTATSMNGRLTALGGTNAKWTFTPDDVESVVSGVGMHDDDYLAFGFWVRERGTGADATYGIGTFSRGSMPFDDNAIPTDPNMAIAALTGTATYTGMAAGMYAVLTDVARDGEAEVPTGSGEFMADVSLTARFGPTGAATDRDDFTIDGMVDNFMNANGDEIMDANGESITDAWSLKLGRAEFAARTYAPSDTTPPIGIPTITPASHSHFFTGATSGMAGGTMGKWTGMFYGPTVTDDATTPVNEAAMGHPTGVAGEFIGYFQNGHVLGAFGAEKE